MPELRVVLTWSAIYDLTDIANQIELRFNRGQAEQFQINIQREIDRFRCPRRLSWRTCMMYRGYEIYKKAFLDLHIFYTVDDEAGEVHVLRVLREEHQGERALPRQAVYA